MSSHHIVRENQEPALLVASGHDLDRELLGQLLEWSPAVITDADNLDYLLSLGIKVDVVFGERPIPIVQEATKFINLLPGQDFIGQALCYLVDNQFRAVNILASAALPSLRLYAEEINIVLFCQNRRYAFFRSLFEKWKPQGEKVYIDESCIKSFQGMDYLAKGVFMTAADGFVAVEFNTDNFVQVGEDV